MRFKNDADFHKKGQKRGSTVTPDEVPLQKPVRHIKGSAGGKT
jgi:hypothetical protein